MKKHLICPCYIVLIVTAYFPAQSEGTMPSVSLTVEGEGSLVGERCPGIIKIVCYGIDLPILRWRYNGNTDIATFFVDTPVLSFIEINNLAFLSVELLSVAQNPVDLNFANFSSELVVDVSKLQTESINGITCGDPGIFKMIPVDVEIIQQTEPESPNVTNVTAAYEFGSLTDVTISWEKLETRCSEFQVSLVYQVTLLGSSVVAVNHTSCGEVCITNFQTFSDFSDEYRVSLYAVNAIGSSEVMEYPTTIAKQSRFYFSPTILSSNCLFTCKCFSNGSLDTDSCNVLYTTDSMYMDASTIVSPLNTQFEITGITSNTIYYFEFSVSVNHTLLVRNILSEQAIASPRFSAVVVAFLTLTILLITVEAAFGIVICVAKQLQRVKARIVFFVVCLLGMLSLIFLIVFLTVSSIQQDTCSLDWSRIRDALIIISFLLALFSNVFLVACFLLAFCEQKKFDKMDLPVLEYSPKFSRHFDVNSHRSDPTDFPIGFQLEVPKRWPWSSQPTNGRQKNQKIELVENTKEPNTSSEPSTIPINKRSQKLNQSKYRNLFGLIKSGRTKDPTAGHNVLEGSTDQLEESEKPEVNEGTHNASNPAPPSEAVPDERHESNQTKRGIGSSPVRSKVEGSVQSSGQTNPLPECSTGDVENPGGTHNASNSAPPSEAVGAKQESGRTILRTIVGLFKSESSTVRACVQPEVFEQTGPSPESMSFADQLGGVKESEKPEVNNASNLVQPSETVSNQTKRGIFSSPFKPGRSKVESSVPSVQSEASSGQTNLLPKSSTGQLKDITEDENSEGTHNASNSAPPSEAVPNIGANQESGRTIRGTIVNLFKFESSKDSTASVEIPCVQPGVSEQTGPLFERSIEDVSEGTLNASNQAPPSADEKHESNQTKRGIFSSPFKPGKSKVEGSVPGVQSGASSGQTPECSTGRLKDVTEDENPEGTHNASNSAPPSEAVGAKQESGRTILGTIVGLFKSESSKDSTARVQPGVSEQTGPSFESSTDQLGNVKESEKLEISKGTHNASNPVPSETVPDENHESNQTKRGIFSNPFKPRKNNTTADSETGHHDEIRAKLEKVNSTSEAEHLKALLSEEVGKAESSQASYFTSEANIYTVYKVVVRLEDRSYFLFRRYGEFGSLFEQIKKKFSSEARLLKVPGKRYLGNNFDPDFIKRRCVGLHDFISNLMKIPNILEFSPVRDFLAMDDQRSALPFYDNENIDEPAEEGNVVKGDIVKLGVKENTTARITDFDLLKVIGKGTFGKVYLGRHKENDTFYAIKALQKKAIDKRSKVKHINERNVFLMNVTHPFLVGLHYSFQTSTKLYFVLNTVNNGKLFFHLQRETIFDEPRARFYAAEITSALGYLHSLNIIYWDLKIENILLDANGHIILTDFGICKENIDLTTSFCSNPRYLAPEVLQKQEYDSSVDWWCLGVVTYEMMYGLPPFYSRYVDQIYDNILREPLQLQPQVTSSAQSLLTGLLQKDKNFRLGSGIGDDKDIKAHSFFGPINWNDLLHKRVKPPFNPPANDALYLQHFNPEFTTGAISDAHSHSKRGTVGMPSVSITDNTFAGFSYAPPSPSEMNYR